MFWRRAFNSQFCPLYNAETNRQKAPNSSLQINPHLQYMNGGIQIFLKYYFFNKWPFIPLEVTRALHPALAVLLRHSRLLLLTDRNACQGISDTSCFLAELKIRYSSDPDTSPSTAEKVGGMA